ncbi:MAG: hypothetical protein CM15mP102_04230 [Flavobacteriales bacterium]|nr:MAG: hypothetical protein CM15mP102_04230 [Flavobacteriales bacterium]
MERKEKRMRFLQRYWSDKLRNVNNVIVNTPIDIDRSCGIGNVGLTNMSPSKWKIYYMRSTKFLLLL